MESDTGWIAESFFSEHSSKVEYMSKYISAEIGVVTNGDTHLGDARPLSYHIDDLPDDIPETRPVYVYIWENETTDRRDELAETVTDLRAEYVFATGIVYIDQLRDLVPLDHDQLIAYAWLSWCGTYNTDWDSDRLERELNAVQQQFNDAE